MVLVADTALLRCLVAVVVGSPQAVPPIQPLAWELPYAVGAALKKTKKKNVF